MNLFQPDWALCHASVISFNMADSFTHQGFSENDGWAPGFLRCDLIPDPGHILKIMAVAEENIPSESFPFICQWLQLHDIGCFSVDLTVDAVDDANELIQFVVCGTHGSLPYASFL
jgi:hypothetical protein